MASLAFRILHLELAALSLQAQYPIDVQKEWFLAWVCSVS